VVDNLNIVAHFLKSLSKGKALEQCPKVIHVVKCKDPDFHKKVQKNKKWTREIIGKS
jgi:hypothetical protein